jgi:hypothetical protein
VLDNYTWIQCTFDPDDPEMPIIAWHKHRTESGGIKYAIPYANDNGDNFCCCMDRPAGRTIEFQSISPNSYAYLDCLVSRYMLAFISGDTTSYLVPNTDMFNNLSSVTFVHRNEVLNIDVEEEVEFFESGYPEDTDLSYMSITLSDDRYSFDVNEPIYIGYSYSPSLTLLPLDTVDTKNSYQGMVKRVVRTDLLLVDSGLPTVEGELPADRSPSTDMGSVEPLYTGIAEYGSFGYDKRKSITIEQTRPMATEIASIAMKVDIQRD